MVDDRSRPLAGDASTGADSRHVLARSRVTMSPETARRVASNEVAKGDVLGAARYAGLQAAKEADSYLPLYDTVADARVVVDFTVGDDSIDVRVGVTHHSDPPPHVEALTAAAAAALTIYDMCKAVDRTMVIGPVELVVGGDTPED
jgi:cyclic pyranopterin phosphate synthase